MTDRFAGAPPLSRVHGARQTPGALTPTPSRTWQPVLDPAERTEAFAVVTEIADALAEIAE